ncbi:MAG: translocation/assembly module TamB domain-containing protein [Deltaproteobacteria bacterium]|nr:translocation/assembly module TamB domain-containing protein [Deltaproteobacteria bacterium]
MKDHRKNGENEPVKRYLRKRLTRIISWITGLSLGAIVLSLVGVLIALTIFVRTDTFQNGLRDRILKLAREELAANITFESAKVSIFERRPKIEFFNVHLQPIKSPVGIDLRRVAVGISPFVSIPLLFLQELHLAYVEIEGMSYDLHSTKTVESFIKSLRPKKSYIPSTFQTSIERVLLKDVDINLQLPPDDIFKTSVLAKLQLEKLEANIDSDEIHYFGQLQFSDTSFGGHGPFSGSLSLEDAITKGDRTVFKNLNLKVGEDLFELSGEVKRPGDPIIDLKGHLSAQLQNYFTVDQASGVMDSTFSVRGPIKTLEGEGQIQLKNFKYASKSFSKVKGDWALKNSKLDLKSFSLKENEEEIILQGSFPLKTEEAAHFQAELKNLDFGSAIGTVAPGLVKWKGATSGIVKYDGTLAPSSKGNFDFDLKMIDFQIRTPLHETEILKTPEVKISGKGTLDGITNGNFTTNLQMADSRWGGTGTWTKDKFDFHWDSTFSGGSLGNFYSRKLELLGAMKGSLQGPWNDLVMSVDQNLTYFILDGHKLSNLKGKLILSDRVLFGAPLVTDEISATGGIRFEHGHDKADTFSDFKFTTKKLDIGFIFSLFKIEADWAKQSRGFITSQGALKGNLVRPIGSGNLLVENWNFKTDKTKGRIAKAKWATAGGEIYFDNAELRASSIAEPLRGELSLDGHGLVDLSMEAQKLRLQDWIYLVSPDSGLQGLVDLDVDYQRGNPSLKSRLKIYETSLAGNSKEDSEMSLDWFGDQIKSSGNIFGESFSFLVQGNQNSKTRELKAKVAMQSFDLIPFFTVFRGSRLEVSLSGDGELIWQQPKSTCKAFLFCFLEEPRQLSGGIQFESSSLQRGKVALQKIDPFKLQMLNTKNGMTKFQFEKIRLYSDFHELSVQGFFESPENFSFAISGATELRSFASLYPQLARSDGLAEVDGTLDAQGFSGKIELSNGLINFQGSPIVIRNVEASLRAHNSSFDLLRLKGDFKEGAVTGSGRFRLIGSDFDSAQVNLLLENSLLQPQEGLSFRMSGPLTLRLTREETIIDGKLSVTEGMFRRRIDARIDILKALEPQKREFKTAEDPEVVKPWKLNVQLQTQEPFVIRNNLAEGAVNFNLYMQGTLREPRLKGSVSILRGQFRYNNREFEVRSGSIQFTDPLSNIPTYDVRADTQVSEYRVDIRLLGGPSEQKILYSSDPALGEKDILSLISFGMPSSAPELNKPGGSSRSTSLSGISYATGILQDKIEGQLSTNFGIRRFHLLPAYFEKTEQMELQLTVGADVIRDRLLVNYSTFLTATQGGQKVELDLRLNRVASLVGSWRDAGDGQNDFGGDLRFRFDFE